MSPFLIRKFLMPHPKLQQEDCFPVSFNEGATDLDKYIPVVAEGLILLPETTQSPYSDFC